MNIKIIACICFNFVLHSYISPINLNPQIKFLF